MSQWLALTARNGTAGPRTRSEASVVREPLPSKDAFVRLTEPELVTAQDRDVFAALGRDGKLVRVEYRDWCNILLPDHMLGVGHVVVPGMDDFYAVSRRPHLVAQSMQEYKYKLEWLLENAFKIDFKVDVELHDNDRYIGMTRFRHAAIGGRNVIALSAPKVTRMSDRGVFECVVHEIAHALVGLYRPTLFGVAHDDLWKKVCIRLGGTGNRFYVGDEHNQFVYYD